uniref:Bug family tripartite tricarboxylate transporter substrate binding protein n=1 Tax=Variovorax sp. BK018 TaxID=3450241 RepID=UPI00403A02D0
MTASTKTHSILTRRALITAGGASLLGGSFFNAAHSAETYPSKSIRMVVPFAPGGGNDIVGRIVGRKCSEVLRQPILVDNRAGAGGRVGAEVVMKAPGDGYTVLLGDASYAINASLYPSPKIDYASDLVLVAVVAATPLIVAVRNDYPSKDVAGLIAAAKKANSNVTVGSAGNGTIGHLAAVLFNSTFKTQTRHVPYKGSAASVNDLAGGQIDALIGTLPAVIGAVKGGMVRAVAVTGKTRSPSLPNVPTVAEATGSDYEVVSWFGVMCPKGVDQTVIKAWSDAIQASLKTSDLRDAYALQGLEVDFRDTPASKKLLDSEIDKWKKVVRENNVSVT